MTTTPGGEVVEFYVSEKRRVCDFERLDDDDSRVGFMGKSSSLSSQVVAWSSRRREALVSSARFVPTAILLLLLPTCSITIQNSFVLSPVAKHIISVCLRIEILKREHK